MSKFNEMGGFNLEHKQLEQTKLHKESAEVPAEFDVPSEFFRQTETNIFLLGEKERQDMSSAIERLGLVKDDPEIVGRLNVSGEELEALDAESLDILDQAKQKIASVESTETTIPTDNGHEVIKETVSEDETSLEGKSLSTSDNLESSGRKEKANKDEPKLTLMKETGKYGIERDPNWKFDQRLKSLEVQNQITQGRDPTVIAESARHLSDRDHYNRSLPKVFEKYRNAYNTVDKYRENNTPPRELFRKIFGVTPKGEITIDYGSIDIAFILEDVSDYARAIYEKDDIDPALSEGVKYHGGSTLSGGSIPKELGGRIIVIPKENEQLVANDLGNILEHERQHVSNTLYKDTRYHDLPRTVTTEDIITAPQESKRATILAYLGSKRKFTDNHEIHGELLAHYRGLDLKSKDEIDKKIVANLVTSYCKGFYKTRIKMCREDLEKIGIDSPMIDDCLTESFQNESWRNIKDSAYCLKDLEDAGLSKDEVINLVQMEPLARWPEVAKQFIEQKNKK